MHGPCAALLGGGERLHLQHGPIDLIIGADADGSEDRRQAFAAAIDCFDSILQGLVDELNFLRAPLHPSAPEPSGTTVRLMVRAARPHCSEHFLTPMIAVAGAVADTVLAAMVAATPLTRAYVNNGGDISVHLAAGAQFSIAMNGLEGRDLGRVCIRAQDGIGGVATSGAGGRSLSFGIADSVTVLAASAAEADVAASLIANAVDLPDHPGILRVPASELRPDSDLGDRLVVASVPRLTLREAEAALAAGRLRAQGMIAAGRIKAAALFLQGQTELVGGPFFAGTGMPVLAAADA